uniref:PIH1 N-terminal domain-containing protein n=1 Tax=Panagrolaimus superbus TaxID=310955 RepID=A0A914Y886_9BILA
MTQTLHDKLKTNKLLVDPTTNPDNFYIVQPTPGMVIKFKKARLQFSHDEEQKCFLNIAHCIEIPAPDNIENEAELAAMMKVDETTCSIPLSLGDMDCVKDKAGENALKFDVVVNSDFYHEKFSKSKFYQQLTIIEALNKIESVHQVRITRSTQVILQNKKVFGALESHKIPKFPENFQEAEEKRKRIIDLTDSKDPFSTYQHENVSMWLENGKLFKAIIRINEIVKADFLKKELLIFMFQ